MQTRRFGVVTVIAMVAGCGFSANLGGEQPGTDAGTEIDAPDGGEPAGVVACNTPDASGLVVCLEFEDSVADGELDDSSPARRNATTMGLAQVPRTDVGGKLAADVGPQAATYVAQAAALDLPGGYTLAAWVRPATVPAASTARGILDHENQYAMIVSATAAGAINNRCQHAGVSKYEYTERLPVEAWSFMACTWNGTQLCAYRWASPTDHEHYCHTPTTGPNATGTDGLAIGHLSSAGAPHSRFDGAIDGVHVYARGMTEAQLCAVIGQPADCMPCDTCL